MLLIIPNESSSLEKMQSMNQASHLKRYPLNDPNRKWGALGRGAPPARRRGSGLRPQTTPSRKRPGSDTPLQGHAVRTKSPSAKFHRQSSANLDQLPETGRKPAYPLTQRSRERSHQFTFTHAPQPPLHNPTSPRKGGFYQELSPPDRRHVKVIGPGTRPAARWSAKRPHGPNVTAKDNIDALCDIRQGSECFTFFEAGDEFANDDSDELSPNEGIIKQPDSRPISQQQLAAEVKGIYSGLVMVESKCVGVVHAQTQPVQQGEAKDQSRPRSSGVDQIPALIALHRTLLHEHHDFFLASQHPQAGNAIKELATKYSMPARMWKHGIHNFLELLRHKLPQSLEYTLAFIYLAYQMMALLFETVPTFEDTWIECLGDLGRYRMAIEDEDLRDREVWTGVARFWYTRAADKNPNIGRLLRGCNSLYGDMKLLPNKLSDHLGILARSNPLQQLSLYCRSLTAVQPFIASRDSIMTLFDPTIARVRKPSHHRPVSDITWFVVMHACMFGVANTLDLLGKSMASFFGGLETLMNSYGRECGGFIASCNIASLLKYGCTTSDIRSILAPKEKPSMRASCPEPRRGKYFAFNF